MMLSPRIGFNWDVTKPKGEIWSMDDAGLASSRWQAQIGIRYIFN